MCDDPVVVRIIFAPFASILFLFTTNLINTHTHTFFLAGGILSGAALIPGLSPLVIVVKIFNLVIYGETYNPLLLMAARA